MLITPFVIDIGASGKELFELFITLLDDSQANEKIKRVLKAHGERCYTGYFRCGVNEAIAKRDSLYTKIPYAWASGSAFYSECYYEFLNLSDPKEWNLALKYAGIYEDICN